LVPFGLQKKIEECNKLKTTLEAKVEDEQKKYDEALESLRAETQEFQDKKEQLETKLIGLQKDENEKESKYSVAKNEIDLMRSTEQRETCKLEQLKQRALNSKNQMKEKEAKLKEHTEKIPELQKVIVDTEAEMETLNKNYETTSKKVNSLRADVEETRSKQSAIKQGGRVLESLMKQKSTGVIKGIYGRLGDLGAIDKKYDVAISTAAGAGLDRILVDTPDTAISCINYLKAKDIGRASILALEQTKG
jgi:structural maintenance of chromosome 4